jgi:DNA polymerase-3 subunit epsilon
MLDLETTGLNTDTDRIWQIALTMHYPDKDPIRWVSLVDPECEVPETASKKFSEINARIKAEKPHQFKVMAEALASRLINVDFGGYNIHYDLKLFRSEMKRTNVRWDWEQNGSMVIDTLRLWQELVPRNLEGAYKEFVDPAGFEDAHDAGKDIAATEEVLVGQLTRFPHLPRTVQELEAICFPQRPGGIDRAGKLAWKGNDPCLSFGKHAWKPLRQVPSEYLAWMVDKGDFSSEVKTIISDALRGKYPVKP